MFEGYKLIDLSTPLSNNPVSEARVSEIEYIDHESEQSVKRIMGRFDCTREELPNKNAKGEGLGNAVEVIHAGTHTATHLDAPWHYSPICEGKRSKTIDEIPLEWCIGDGVVLDFRRFGDGHVITKAELQEELARIGYTVKPFDIVFIMTGRDKEIHSKAYFEQPGMGREGTLWLAEQGVKIMGIDAWGFDTSFAKMKEAYKATGDNSVIWQAHLAGREKEYCHIEKLTNLDKLPPFGFTVICFPVKIERASAGWTRVVALVKE